MMMPSDSRKIVVLGSGGTIAGVAADAADNVGYHAAQIGVAQLVGAVPALRSWPLEAEQVAQLDSKDMDIATWQALARRAAHHLARADVAGCVMTHGTDTLEETAYFLHRVLAPAKPLVLTAAMRPATSLQADGPQNLLDACTVAASDGARGVSVVIDSGVFHPVGVRKWHSHRLDAFSGGDAGAIGRVEQGAVRRFRDWPSGGALGLAHIAHDAAAWPRVEIVLNHAGADGTIVDALLARGGVAGIVVAGTGNGTVSAGLAAALRRARQVGVWVRRSTRCAAGPVIDAPDAEFAGTGELSAVQARVEMLLDLLGPPG